jgi:HEAT repeat protein
MTHESADPQMLRERYLARLISLETTRGPVWSAAWATAVEQAGDEVVAQGPAGLEALHLILLDTPTPARARLQAANALARNKHPAGIAILETALRTSTDNHQRRQLADSLRLAGSAAAPAIPELIQLLAEKDYMLPSLAASTLVSIGAPAVEPLLAVLFVSPMQRRANAAEALGRIRDLRALEPLQAACGDRWPSMRRAAATALGYLGDPRATATLLALLDDAKPLIRGSAIEALGKMAGHEVIPALTAATTDTTHIRGWESVATIAKRAIAIIQVRSGIVPHP